VEAEGYEGRCLRLGTMETASLNECKVSERLPYLQGRGEDKGPPASPVPGCLAP
jgi:hypothetical protein